MKNKLSSPESTVGTGQMPKNRKIDIPLILGRYGILIGYVIFVIVASILSPRFLTPVNILNIVRQVSIFGILAIGQKPDLSFLTPADGVALNPGGTIQIDPATLATSAPGIYAGGDVAFGPRNLIEAVANGKKAAASIHGYLAGQQARLETHLEIETLVTERYRMSAGFERLDREAPPTLDVGRRTGIAEVETGYETDAARQQAARCLVCHVQTIYDPELCVLCNRCVDICPEYCLSFVPLDALDLSADERLAMEARAQADTAPLTALVKDDDRCIRCGLCAVRCPTGAMTMERFTVTERWATAADGVTEPRGSDQP